MYKISSDINKAKHDILVDKYLEIIYLNFVHFEVIKHVKKLVTKLIKWHIN